MTVDLNTTLTNYYIMIKQGLDKSKEDHPILSLQTKNGVKELKLITDKRQISWYVKVLAFFGLGNASLKNVRNYLEEHKDEISKENTQALRIINSKISLRNQSSRIQNIPLLNSLPWNLCLKKGSYSSYVGSTSIPQQPESAGIIDFTKVFPEKGLAYIADGTGHAVEAQKQKAYAELWEIFDKEITEQSNIKSPEACQEQLKSLLTTQSKRFGEKGYASTLIISQLIIGLDGKKSLAHVAVGDSDLYCLRKNGQLELITSSNINDPSRGAELSGDTRKMHKGFTEVNQGDKVIGITDGISDFMSEETLKSVLLDIDTTSENLGDKLYKRLIEGNCKGEKALDRTDRKKSDDISVFMMIMP